MAVGSIQFLLVVAEHVHVVSEHFLVISKHLLIVLIVASVFKASLEREIVRVLKLRLLLGKEVALLVGGVG